MKPRIYTPHPFAPLVMNHLAQHPRCAVWAKPGMGKTTLTANFLDVLYNFAGESEPTLVVAPLRVARDTWPEEPRKWQHLQGFEVQPIIGTFEERDAALRKDRMVYSINYENLVWLSEWLESHNRPWPFGTVIADEATKLKGFRVQQGTQRAAALGKIAHAKVRRWVNLTGTPAPNGLKDLWGQTWFLDAGQRLGRTYTAFEQRWFAYQRIKDAVTHKPGVVTIIQPGADEQIHERLHDICLSLDPRDWFDLKEPRVNVIEVDMPQSARKKYRELERDYFTEIDGRDVEALNAAGLSNKCLQLASGAAYLDPARYPMTGGEKQWIEVHFEKLDALEELIDETGDDPLLVVYQFRSDAARILRDRRFEGKVLQLAKEADLRAAKAGKGKLWLAHPESLGHGVDGLQEHCNQVVFFSQTWNLEHHDQVLERVGPMRQLQAGKDREVWLHYIVARKTLDEAVLARQASKRGVQDALFAYMKGEL